MKKDRINQVLAMSNSAVGRWAGRRAPPPVPIGERQVLGYCRFSTGGQSEATIEKQEEIISVYCAGKGMRKPRFFKDRAASGINDDRVAWKDLTRSLRPSNVVVLQEITRLARDTFTALKMIRQVQSAGATVEIVNIGTQDTIYLTIMSAVAEYDYRSVTTRLRDGRAQSVADGFPNRKACYGYDKIGKDFVINEVQARWVREIFSMHLAGAKTGDVVRHLVRSKAPTAMGGSWNSARIAAILYNPLYAGVLVQKRPVFSWEKNV